MQRALPTSLLLTVLLLLGGCQLVPRAISPDAPPLLSPAAAGFTLQATQQLTLQQGDNRHQLLAALAVEPQQLRLTGVSSLGQRLLQLDYDGHNLRSQHYHDLQLPLSDEWILVQLQLAYWPLAQLQAGWGAPWQVTTDGRSRTLQLEQRPLITVTYRPLTNHTPATDRHIPDPAEHVVITHHRSKTSLTVTTLQTTTTAEANRHE
ncbi:DUF3261 domain-containing protein [Pseudomaricurvus sp. HS19]|uniref:DUF3261 domain-containing protein n=1 Tax=Pseudomaricurvus sp. HS19 TaxID=2692626 RepID=UPI00136CDFD9|nr:DUF3261 domain-containing protein [Pseudomaricurvus sp. HS19]MYM63975.1 DUF3261 domain-containing protein [Pseudomaricurvus sp. HS19]